MLENSRNMLANAEKNKKTLETDRKLQKALLVKTCLFQKQFIFAFIFIYPVSRYSNALISGVKKYKFTKFPLLPKLKLCLSKVISNYSILLPILPSLQLPPHEAIQTHQHQGLFPIQPEPCRFYPHLLQVSAGVLEARISTSIFSQHL